MDLIQSYHDQGSQSSSSGDDINLSHRSTTTPSTSFGSEHAMSNKVSGFTPIERIPIDRLMIATAAIAAKKPPKQKQKQKQAANNPANWLAEVEKELRMCLGSIQTLQKHTILDAMDRFINKLSKDYEKSIKPSTADVLCHHIRTYLHIYKYLFRSMEKGKRYFKRFIKLLAIYTDLELCASIRGTEYDKSIAERIVLNYQTYLDNSDNAMVLDVLLNTKRLWRQHRGILVLLFEYFLVRKSPIELPDMLFMKNLIMFKKWLYIEDVPEERQKARDAFVQFVKPKKTLCMNSLFKPYLPVDEEGFVTITNSDDILKKEYALSPLIRCLKKAEVNLEVQQNEEVIVLTDDENDRDNDESSSNQGTSSATFSQQDESNDYDWYSASSQQGSQSFHNQNIVETVSIDSPPPPPYKKTASLSSLDSCDLNLDTTNSLATDRNSESVPRSDTLNEQDQNLEALPSTSQEETPDLNGDNNRGLSTLDESMFNRLVNDINSTHVSVPGNGNLSADSKINENGGESTQTAGSGEIDSQSDEHVGLEERSENDHVNGIQMHTNESESLTIPRTNGESPVSDQKELGNELTPSVSQNHIESMNICHPNTIVISSGALLRNHEETLKNIEEIVTDDLKNHEKTPNAGSTSAEVDTRIESNKEIANNSETVQETTPQDFVPAAESTVTETSLLSKSEQDVLFKDRDAAMIFTDLWNNGPAEETAKSDEGNKLVRQANDTPSPITFLQNGIDPSLRMKTYARRNRRFVETKTISTQTSSHSGCPSPVTTIDESDSRKKDKHLLTEKEDDELFLRDVFNIPESTPRTGNSPRMRSPMYSASTPVASTPIASTSIAVPMENGSLQTTFETTTETSVTGSTEVVVKRKRGRPRKYPLPGPGTTPVVPKPKAPRQPRKPREPKPPKDPNESGEEVVFERMKLRERKPKILPTPPPPPPPKKKSLPRRSRSPRKPTKAKEQVKAAMTEKEIERQKDRRRRRNTIKMTIDAILNTQSTSFSAIQARRISQILGIPISAPQIATILKRRNYEKSINSTLNNDSELNESGSMLQTFKNRSNGQMNSTEPITSTQNTTSTPSTILARKTYIKPNITFSSFSSALRRISRLNSRRISFGTRRISFSSSIPRHPVVTAKRGRGRPRKDNSPQKSTPQSQQRYTKIDIFDTSTKSKRGRKKGSKDTKPRKRSTPRQKNESNIGVGSALLNPIVDLGQKVHEDIELVDLTKEIAPFELDATDEMNMQFNDIDNALSSTQHIHNDSESFVKKRPNFLSDDETDVTNEFTTDQESAVEDTDDSRTRKSKRSTLKA